MLKIELFIVLIIYGLLQGQARLSIHQLEMEIYNTQNDINALIDTLKKVN